MKLIKFLLVKIVEFFFVVYIRFVGMTSKLIVKQPELLKKYSKKQKILLAFWHNRIFYFLYLFRKTLIATPISQHKDGEFIANIAKKFKIIPIRGSTTRGGVKVLRGMLDFLNQAVPVSITPDGPRGPKYVIQPGILYVALKSQKPIVAGSWYAKHVKIFSSWDNFILPLPFNTFYVVFSEPISIKSETEFEEKKKILKEEMDRITNETEQYFK